MSETITITLEVNNRTEFENLAREKGYATVQAYLMALVAADQDEDDDYDLETGLREAFRDIREGRTYPIESLRDMLEADDDEI
jgi:hypothetical protein